MKVAIRCTKVSERPDVSAMKAYDPQIQLCENCKEKIWVTRQSREIYSQLGKDNSSLLCKKCASTISTEYLAKKDAVVIHCNSDATEITEIKLEK